MEPITIKHLADAVAALQAAQRATQWGFVSDPCEIALGSIAIAIQAACDPSSHSEMTDDSLTSSHLVEEMRSQTEKVVASLGELRKQLSVLAAGQNGAASA